MRAHSSSLRAGVVRLLGATACAAALFSASPAQAVGDGAPVDMNRFHPAPGNAKLLSTDLADVGPHLQVVPQLFMHYANRPLVYVLGSTPAADLIKHRLTADLSVSIALWRRLQIALAMPVTLFQCAGQAPVTSMDGSVGFPPAVCDNSVLKSVTFPPSMNGGATPPQDLASAGQEDLRLLIKGVIWNNHRIASVSAPLFGVAASGDLTLPTGNANSYLGSRLPTFTLRLIGHLQYKRLTMALNFGGLFGSVEQLYNIKTGSGLSYSVGVQVEMFRYRLFPFYAVAEVFGITHYPFDSLRTSPAELSLALKAAIKEWTLFVGGGPGLNPGYGVPDGRVFVGVTYAWQKIPQQPKPLPPPPPPPPDFCPNLPGAQEQIPQGMLKDEKGNCVTPPPPPPPPPTPPPVCDPEKQDCPDRPKPPVAVKIENRKLVLSERIFFEFDKDTILPVSFPILDEVARVLKVRPDIKRMRIEGHTDNYGSDAYNLDLSHRRAASVMVYLVEHGIETFRLTSAGFGFRCPLVDNDTPDNRAKNRRVDFIILEQEGVQHEEPKCKVPPQLPTTIKRQPPGRPGQRPGGAQVGAPGTKPATPGATGAKPAAPAAPKPATPAAPKPAAPAAPKPAAGTAKPAAPAAKPGGAK